MNLLGKKILLTGATGGIGYPLALLLAKQGAELALVGSSAAKLAQLRQDVQAAGGKCVVIEADLSKPENARQVIDAASQGLGTIDILINNAGVMDFTLFEDQSPERIQQMININVTTPITLTRLLLPLFQARNSGMVVNVGSIFGTLGFPHYATYCGSKFAMRGFSQSLRRELVDSNIKVTYIAPRAVKTALNDEATTLMLQAANINMDEPEFVAAEILKAITKEKQEHYIGQPESTFAWLNSFAPKFINLGLKKQARFARPYAQRKL